MQNFYLPDFYFMNSYIINQYMIDLIRSKSEKVRENINIGAIYGSFPCQIWNGGRAFGLPKHQPSSKEEIVDIIHMYEELDVPMRFTYTNSLITEEHLNDEYCNFITTMAQNGKNEILVNSPILEEYLRKNYPNYKYLSSTTKCLLNREAIIQEAEKYYLTVLDYRYNNNFDFLAGLSTPSQYEVLIDPRCGVNCTRRKDHYERLSKIQMGLESEDNVINQEGCDFYGWFRDALRASSAIVKVEDLDKYEQLGYHHFKIEGRYYPMYDVIESYVYYLIKPEYRDDVRFELLKLVY